MKLWPSCFCAYRSRLRRLIGSRKASGLLHSLSTISPMRRRNCRLLTFRRFLLIELPKLLIETKRIRRQAEFYCTRISLRKGVIENYLLPAISDHDLSEKTP